MRIFTSVFPAAGPLKVAPGLRYLLHILFSQAARNPSAKIRIFIPGDFVFGVLVSISNQLWEITPDTDFSILHRQYTAQAWDVT